MPKQQNINKITDMITSKEIKEKATQWSTLDPDQPETQISVDEARIAYESFIRGAEWMQYELEKQTKTP